MTGTVNSSVTLMSNGTMRWNNMVPRTMPYLSLMLLITCSMVKWVLGPAGEKSAQTGKIGSLAMMMSLMIDIMITGVANQRTDVVKASLRTNMAFARVVLQAVWSAMVWENATLVILMILIWFKVEVLVFASQDAPMVGLDVMFMTKQQSCWKKQMLKIWWKYFLLPKWWKLAIGVMLDAELVYSMSGTGLNLSVLYVKKVILWIAKQISVFLLKKHVKVTSLKMKMVCVKTAHRVAKSAMIGLNV